MELMDIVSALGNLVEMVLAVVGLCALIMYRKMKTHVEQVLNATELEAEADSVGLDIELDNGVYFCYNSKDQQFICQGTSVQEIKQSFQIRYPEKNAYLASGDPVVVEQLKHDAIKLMQHENSLSK